MKRRNNKKALLAILIVGLTFLDAVLVVVSVNFAFKQWVGDEAIEELQWVAHNLDNSDKPVIFVIHSNISVMADYLELWRRVIGCFIPNSLIYTGAIDDLLSFREPQFNNTKLQALAEEYWNELRTQVRYPENLTSIEVLVLSYFYQPITEQELQTRLTQLSDGVYVVNNYTAADTLTLYGSFDYYSMKGPWYAQVRDWASSGIVLEINADVTTESFVEYDFNIDKIANYTVNIFAFDSNLGYVPVAIVMDNMQIMLIRYSGTESPKTFSPAKMLLTEGFHGIKITPAENGSLFFDLDYIEIDKADN